MEQLDHSWRERVATARVARLATVRPEAIPHVVPITFALHGETIVTAVDDKPKRTERLQRLDNIAANPAVSVLVDHYDEDWRRLWWARADGTARVENARSAPAAVDLLTAKYPPYRERRPDGALIVVAVARWTVWSAAG